MDGVDTAVVLGLCLLIFAIGAAWVWWDGVGRRRWRRWLRKRRGDTEEYGDALRDDD